MFTDALEELHELLPKGLIASCDEIEPPRGNLGLGANRIGKTQGL